jgi:hypothetical protein
MFENFSEKSLKGDLSNATTFDPPLFSLVNTFNHVIAHIDLKKLQKNDPFKLAVHVAAQSDIKYSTVS